MTRPDPEITKWHFLGSVDYAQHNFARLKPLLYSETGRRWDGSADRAWFPNEGLVFTVQADLRYAQHGSLWIFRVTRNPRADAVEKDLFSAVQSKPATELVLGMEPRGIEDLRQLVADTGVPVSGWGKSGVALPELDERWVVLSELQRDEQGGYRPAASVNLKHLKVLIGTPEELCGLSTSDGRYALPPNPPASGESRNWLPPAQFLESLASDLQRWVPHGPQRPKAKAAAQALRELSPHLAGLAALKADDAKVAMARASNLVDAAETITEAAETILGLVVEQEPFKAEIERRRAAIHGELEAEAIAAIEQKEGAARDRLLAEQASLRAEMEASTGRLNSLKQEVAALEAEAATLRSARSAHVEALDAQVDALLQRAAAEPARLLAEWLGVSGFVIGGMGEAPAPESTPDDGERPPPNETAPEAISRPIERDELGAALFGANPASNPGAPRLLIIDAALRARELPVLIGPHAREFAEAWLAVAGGEAPLVVVPDPTLLSLNELTPTGARGEKAPLAPAFRRAVSRDEPMVVLLDDLDPAAAGFWLPELARAQRHPERYGMPPNLLFMAVLEAEPGQMSLTPLRAGELFPLVFDDCDPTSVTPDRPASPSTLTTDLIRGPQWPTSWPARVEAFQASLLATFKPEEAASLAAGLSDYLQHLKGGGAAPRSDAALASLLTRSAARLGNGNPGGN